MLHAVPAQGPAPESQQSAFSRAVADALTLDGPEAHAQIVRLHNGEVAALKARVDGLTQEASAVADEHRRHFTMLTQLQATAAHKLWEVASMSAELATYREMFGRLRSLADRAGDTLDTTDVRAVLATEPLDPVYSPTALAFVPGDQFRGGQFVALAGDVTFVFTFVGWALIDHGPGAYGVVEPMFLVDDRAMAKSTIEHERHVKFERYLPHLERVA